MARVGCDRLLEQRARGGDGFATPFALQEEVLDQRVAA